jgi:thioredoxin 1
MAGANTKEFTESNFESEVLSANVPVLVDFWRNGACLQGPGPTIDELANEYAGKVKIGKVNTDQNHRSPHQFGNQLHSDGDLFQNGQSSRSSWACAAMKDFKLSIDQLLAPTA